jgi:hypothetical protein
MSDPLPYGSPERGDPEAAARAAAIRSVKNKRAFRTHLFSYVVVNGMIFLIWLVVALSAGDGTWFPWFVFPMLGWGIGLAFSWRAAYGPGTRPISDAEIEAELRRMRGPA